MVSEPTASAPFVADELSGGDPDRTYLDSLQSRRDREIEQKFEAWSYALGSRLAGAINAGFDALDEKIDARMDRLDRCFSRFLSQIEMMMAVRNQRWSCAADLTLQKECLLPISGDHLSFPLMSDASNPSHPNDQFTAAEKGDASVFNSLTDDLGVFAPSLPIVEEPDADAIDTAGYADAAPNALKIRASAFPHLTTVEKSTIEDIRCLTSDDLGDSVSSSLTTDEEIDTDVASMENAAEEETQPTISTEHRFVLSRPSITVESKANPDATAIKAMYGAIPPLAGYSIYSLSPPKPQYNPSHSPYLEIMNCSLNEGGSADAHHLFDKLIQRARDSVGQNKGSRKMVTMMSHVEECGIAIFGGCVVGLVLASALSIMSLTKLLKVAIVDSNPSLQSEASLIKTGTPHARMRVWEYTGLGYTGFNSRYVGKDCLGCVVGNHVLCNSLLLSLQQHTEFQKNIHSARLTSVTFQLHPVTDIGSLDQAKRIATSSGTTFFGNIIEWVHDHGSHSHSSFIDQFLGKFSLNQEMSVNHHSLRVPRKPPWNGHRNFVGLATLPLNLDAPSKNVSYGEGYVGLFVRMLGLDNKEAAAVTLWKYLQWGKDCIEGIMQFQGCILFVVGLLNSNSSSTCEATAGLVRNVSSLTSDVKEQTLCTLWDSSAHSPFLGFQQGWMKCLDGAIDNALNLVLFLDFLKSGIPALGGGLPRTSSVRMLTVVLTYMNCRGLNIVGWVVGCLGIISLIPFLIMRSGRWFFVDLHNVDWNLYLNTLAGEVNPQKKTWTTNRQLGIGLHEFQTWLIEAPDERLKAIPKALVNIKVLKLYTETHFRKVIEGLRAEECKWLLAFQVQRTYNSLLFWSPTVVISSAAFSACYLLEIPLHPSNIFTFVATLRLGQGPVRSITGVIGIFIQAKVAFGRIIKFLHAVELQTGHVRRKTLVNIEHPNMIESLFYGVLLRGASALPNMGMFVMEMSSKSYILLGTSASRMLPEFFSKRSQNATPLMGGINVDIVLSRESKLEGMSEFDFLFLTFDLETRSSFQGGCNDTDLLAVHCGPAMGQGSLPLSVARAGIRAQSCRQNNSRTEGGSLIFSLDPQPSDEDRSNSSSRACHVRLRGINHSEE